MTPCSVSVWVTEPAGRVLVMDLRQYTNAYTSFSSLKLSIIMHEALSIYTCTHTHLNPFRKGPLHDCVPGCEWINLNPHHPTFPPWFPVGQLPVSILLCLCFHQHGAQSMLNFPLQAFTDTLLPLYCPEPSIMFHTTIKSLNRHWDDTRFARSGKTWVGFNQHLR